MIAAREIKIGRGGREESNNAPEKGGVEKEGESGREEELEIQTKGIVWSERKYLEQDNDIISEAIV